MRYTRDHVRKVCGCPRKRWGTCPHGWHFAFFFGKAYRFSLDKYLGRHPEGWEEARDIADRIRLDVKAGKFEAAIVRGHQPPPQAKTFRQFADTWQTRHGDKLTSGRIHAYRLGTICAFVLPGTTPPLAFGQKPITDIMTDDVDALREYRLAHVSNVAWNHDFKLLRSMFNWAILKGYTEKSPFSRHGVPTMTLEREIPRHWRFESADDETRLLAAAQSHLHAVIIAMLDTACRPGEILGLQWRDVSLERSEFVVQALKAKTRTGRPIPISKRLLAVMEMRRLDPAGEDLPGAAYVFGDELGHQMKSGRVRDAWIKAAKVAGLEGFHLADLRHEAACRFEEAGVPISVISRLLGHTSLTTTSRYLMNIQRRTLRRAVESLERARELPPPVEEEEEGGDESTEKLC